MSGTVFVCAGCPGGAALRGAVAAALAGMAETLGVAPAACLGRCARPGVVAFRAPGRAVFVFDGVVPGDGADLALFAGLWARAHRGEVQDATPLGALRMKLAARIPALPGPRVAAVTPDDAAQP